MWHSTSATRLSRRPCLQVSRGYSLCLAPLPTSSHTHAVEGISELSAAVAANPIRPTIQRENPAQMPMMAPKNKVQHTYYAFHNHSSIAGQRLTVLTRKRRFARWRTRAHHEIEGFLVTTSGGFVSTTLWED